jgi:chemotaxis protein MotB
MSDHENPLSPEHDHDDEEHLNHHAGEHEEGGHGEPWLVSYADLMTLLFGFFVLQYTFAVAKLENDPNMIKVRKELSAYFGGKYVDPTEQVDDSLKKLLDANNDLKKSIELSAEPDGLRIVITSQLLFASGDAKLSNAAEAILSKIAKQIYVQSENTTIRIEGYTDDNPIVHSENYATNWELSAARAIAVLQVFRTSGFASSRLQATSFADGRPLFPNRDTQGAPIPENQAKNRCVVIHVVANALEKPKPSPHS